MKKLTITSRKPSQKSINRNSNSNHSDTDLLIDRGRIKYLEVSILCRSVTHTRCTLPVTIGHVIIEVNVKIQKMSEKGKNPKR